MSRHGNAGAAVTSGTTAAMTAKEQKKIMRQKKRKENRKLMKQNWILYLFILPSFLYLIIFNYAPMFGVQIAFRDFNFVDGIFGSEWVGWKWFKKFLDTPRFWLLMKNTLKLSIYSLIAGFPLPIILALILNNVQNAKWKKFAQTITYMPHFISTVVLVGMMSIFFSPSSGIVNTILSWFGFSGETYFMGKASYFSHMYVWSGVWQGMGWSSIIYMSALASVDQGLHEAAMIDGANKIKRVFYIDLPTIAPTIIIMLILNCGSLLGVGWEKVYLMQNDLNITTSEVISTYVYKLGLQQQKYSYSSAIGLFNSVVNFIILAVVNKIAAKVSDTSLW